MAAIVTCSTFRGFLAVPWLRCASGFPYWLFGRCLCRLLAAGFLKLCGRSSPLLALSIASSSLSSSFWRRLRLPRSPLPCCSNCSPGERSNHGADDRHAQCSPGHGSSSRPTQSASSRAYACISGSLILIFVVHVSLPLTETTLASVSLVVNQRHLVMHCRETLLSN